MGGGQAVEFNRLALLRLLKALFDAAGMTPEDAPLARLPRPVRLMIARVLLPAESATKRLILFLSRRKTLPPEPERTASSAKRGAGTAGRKSGTVAPSFWLFDRRKFFPELADQSRRVRRGPPPRILDFDSPYPGGGEGAVPAKPARHPDDAVRLCRRMQALYRALQDLDAQAMRLLRMMARRDKAPPGPGRYGPMRAGFPPGYRQNRTHAVDVILYECHMMAWFDRPPSLAPS